MSIWGDAGGAPLIGIVNELIPDLKDIGPLRRQKEADIFKHLADGITVAFSLRKDLDTVQHRDLGVKRVLQRILLIFLFRYVKGDLQTRLAPIPGNQLVLQKIMTRKLPVKYLPV